jgi:hypothetical protein
MGDSVGLFLYRRYRYMVVIPDGYLSIAISSCLLLLDCCLAVVVAEVDPNPIDRERPATNWRKLCLISQSRQAWLPAMHNERR